MAEDMKKMYVRFEQKGSDKAVILKFWVPEGTTYQEVKDNPEKFEKVAHKF